MPTAILTVDAADSDLRPLAGWRRTVLLPRLQAGATVTSLRGPSAHPFNFRMAVSKAAQAGEPFKYVSAMGHGLPAEFTSEGKVVFDSDDHALFNGMVVHLLSCFTAQQLGFALAGNGSRAFLGYRDRFYFTGRVPAGVVGVTQASLQEIYFECAAQVDIALANGSSVSVAHQLAIDAFNQRIEELEAMEPPFFDVATELELNRDAFCSPVVDPLWGDENATL